MLLNITALKRAHAKHKKKLGKILLATIYFGIIPYSYTMQYQALLLVLVHSINNSALAALYVERSDIDTFIYKASGGLTHFMGGYQKACVLAEKYNASLIIDTTHHHGFPWQFSEVFGNVPHYIHTYSKLNTTSLRIWDTYSITDIKNAIPTHTAANKNGWVLLNKTVDIKHHENYQHQIGRVRIVCGRGGFKTPSGSLNLCIRDSFYANMLKYAPNYMAYTTKPYLAIHIRYTDKRDHLPSRITSLATTWDPTRYAFVYVASDSSSIITTLQHTLPHIPFLSAISLAVNCSNNNNNNSPCTQHLHNNNNNVSLDSQKHAFANTWVDLYILVHATTFIGSKVSGLSKWVERIRYEKSRALPTLFDPCDGSHATTIVVLGFSGWGSQLLHLCAHYWVAETQNRALYIDDSAYFYRWNTSLGLLKGYLSVSKHTISNQADYYQQHLRTPANYARPYGKRPIYSPNTDLLLNKKKTLVIQADNKHFRATVKQMYTPKIAAQLYTKIAAIACDQLQFNARAQQTLDTLQQHYAIPNLTHTSRLVGTSVAFHIRRGDKLKRESLLYRASSYIEKYTQVLRDLHIEKIQHATAFSHQMIISWSQK